MALSAADRQRRSRMHKGGDHSFCDPARCDGSAPANSVTASRSVTSRSVATPDARFGPRGQKLWDDLNDGTRTPGEIVLIEESCRIADRLDRLHAVLAGDQMTWMMLRPSGEEGEVAIVVDAALSQARMHASTLKSLVTELRQSAAGDKKPAGQGVSILDQLAARRSRRLSGSPGS